jgi:hypothetical protein
VFFGPARDLAGYCLECNLPGGSAEDFHFANPADVCMRLLVDPKNKKQGEENRNFMCDKYATSHAESKRAGSDKHVESDHSGEMYDASFCTQVIALMRRDMKMRMRSKMGFHAQIIRIIAFGVIFAIAFGRSDIDQLSLFSLSAGVLFFSVMLQVCAALLREKGVRLAQKMQAGPCIPVGEQLERLKLAQLLGQLGVFLTLRLLRFRAHR